MLTPSAVLAYWMRGSMAVPLLSAASIAPKGAGVKGSRSWQRSHLACTKEVGRLQQLLEHTSLEMVRHYVAMASVQQNLLERRASPMDRFGAEQGGPRHARRAQPRRKRSLRLVR